MVVSLLILTDFFQAADRALDYAVNLAPPLGARLVLLHVRRDSLLDPERFTGELTNLNTEAIRLAFKSLAHDLPVPVVAEVGHGRLAEAVADAVGRHQPALVVLGRRDTESIPDELVSTAAMELLRAAPQPMLVVPHSVAAGALPRRVLLAVDAEDFSLGAHAGMVRHFFSALHAQLTVLHIGHAADEAAALEAVTRTGLAVDLPAVRIQSLVYGSPAEGILQVAAPDEYDLVVLIARPRSFFGDLFHHSVTAHVLRHSLLPVLVLPAH